jgi:DmsE family decaheme c-type cytochrome
MLKKHLYFFGTLCLAMSLMFLGSINVQADSEDKVGDETCAACHDEVSTAFTENVHMKLTMKEGFICESCHGPGAKHAEEGDPDLMYNPKTEFNATKDVTCLNCHKSGQFESMSGNAHWEQANGCSDCHTVHGKKENLLKTSSKKLCNECHRDVQSQFRLTSHHPVPEGLMECKSCHNVHGDQTKFAMTNESTEMCLSCHSSKEGPFLYEHQPVSENCNICHSPHGTVANNLLVQNEPALCMSCHPMHFHSTLTGFEGSFTTPLDPTRGGVSTTSGFKQAFTTKCTQCHTQVHGSDLPSQGLSSHGKSLTR